RARYRSNSQTRTPPFHRAQWYSPVLQALIAQVQSVIEGSGVNMAFRKSARYLMNITNQPDTYFTLLILFGIACGVSGFQVLVPPEINGELGMSAVLSCRIQLDVGQSLTQSSWERRLPSGWVTVAVYNPDLGISIQPEYEHRMVYRKPSIHDSTIILNDLRFSDVGDYKCKARTFPLGIERAFTTLSVLSPVSITTKPPTTPVLHLNPKISTTAAPGNKQQLLFTFPAQEPLNEYTLCIIVGGLVSGVLFLLLLVLCVVCYKRWQRTFRGENNTKQNLGPSDMQEALPPPLHKLHINTNAADMASPDTKLEPCHDINGAILSEKDREERGGFELDRSSNEGSRALRQDNTHQNLHNHHNHNQSYQPNHHPTTQLNHQPDHQSFLCPLNKHRSSLEPEFCTCPHVIENGSPLLPEDCNYTDFVLHTDGSIISRWELHV
ncbi:nectin-3-like protein isoform X1, partial [Tachysurus ichikawai]